MDLFYHPELLRLASLWFRFQAALRRKAGAVKKTSRQRAAFYQYVWEDAASKLGAEIEELGAGIRQFTRGDFVTNVMNNYTAIDDPVTLMLAGNKAAVYRLLAKNCLPIPRHLLFSLDTFHQARDFLREAAGPCVVKPAKDTGAGDGVSTGITTKWRLARAAAAAHCRELIIEEQVSGSNYRLLYLDGVLVDAVLRRPPAVIGNGRSTIRELVNRENSQRIACGYKAAQVLLTVDGEMRRTLTMQGLSIKSIPPAGQKVIVKNVINENSASENETAMHLLCDSVVEDGARAARCVGSRLAGVDIITKDPSRPLADTGGVVLEVNTTPGFYYHYCRQGEACPVALHVLRRLENMPGVVPAEATA